MIFLENFQRGGGVIFNAKFMLHILDLCIGLFSDVFQKKLQHYFTKMKGGGGHKPFGIFPKIYPFW